MRWPLGAVVNIRIDLTGRVVAAGIALIILLVLASWGGVEYYTGQSSFCGGSCHTMTEQYDAWKNNTHHASKNAEGMQADCVDCHFLPGEKYSIHAKLEGLRHMAAYFYDKDAPLPIRPVIKDGACLSSGCHEKAKFEDKELMFTPKVRFKHKVHFGDKALEGQMLTCDTCHIKVTKEKHFEVPKDICFLCHLKLEKPTLDKAKVEKIAVGTTVVEEVSFRANSSLDFNKGASRCDICHEIPTKSLQAQLKVGDSLTRPITHQTIQKADVACESCHFEIVKGSGEINTGNVVSNGCMRCHNRSDELLAKAQDKKLMHNSHIGPAKADCFDCHEPIEHRNRKDHLDFVRTDCQLCHQDQHKYQKILLAGAPVNENLSGAPHLMFNVNVNCMACHLKKEVNRGHAVRTGAKETCAACHTEKHKQMLDDWKTQVDKEVKSAEEFEQEVVQTLAQVKGTIAAESFNQAQQMVKGARDLLNIVRFGNGVHNKKYAIAIIDEAFGGFEGALEIIEGQ